MKTFIFGFFAVALCFAFAESLSCNTCTVGLFGKCFFTSTTICPANQSCYTGSATFTNIPSFSGFNSQGCINPGSCTNFTTAVFFSNITVTRTCCNNTDNCNPISLNGAPSAELSLTVAVGAALVASMWNSWLQ